MTQEKQCLKICETCPFLKKNHGKEHPAGWYKASNLKRLWSGLRSGKAPGMVCHSTDPDSIEYGAEKKVVNGQKRECAGAIGMVVLHINEINKSPDIKSYQKKFKLPLTKSGILFWANRLIFGPPVPNVEIPSSPLGLPWDAVQPGEQPPEPPADPVNAIVHAREPECELRAS